METRSKNRKIEIPPVNSTNGILITNNIGGKFSVAKKRKKRKRQRRNKPLTNKFKCTLCPKVYKSIYVLKKHIKNHERGFKLNCEFCKENFLKMPELNIHVLNVHRQTLLECDLCYRKFPTIHNLDYHKHLHTKERRFKCDECGKAFLTNVSVKEHKVQHSGEKPFKCVCGESYAYKSSLNYHIKYRQCKDKKEILFECPKCPVTYKKKHYFIQHINKHIEDEKRIEEIEEDNLRIHNNLVLESIIKIEPEVYTGSATDMENTTLPTLSIDEIKVELL